MARALHFKVLGCRSESLLPASPTATLLKSSGLRFEPLVVGDHPAIKRCVGRADPFASFHDSEGPSLSWSRGPENSLSCILATRTRPTLDVDPRRLRNIVIEQRPKRRFMAVGIPGLKCGQHVLNRCRVRFIGVDETAKNRLADRREMRTIPRCAPGSRGSSRVYRTAP
jgi:hypothetical protein